jgi:hypothetical protein
MDKLEHFLKRNQHRTVYYFTDRKEIVYYVMILSIHDGVLYILDVRDGGIPYIETGQVQKRFYVEPREHQDFPDNMREQPIEDLIKDKSLFRDAIKMLIPTPLEGSLLCVGPRYLLDVKKDGTFTIFSLVDFLDSLNQHGIFQKYDLEYFYNHKNTITHTVRDTYTCIQQNFIANMEKTQHEWDLFCRDPSKYFQGIHNLLLQYHERGKQYTELKTLLVNMYDMWKKLSAEYDMLEVQGTPISFDQNLQQNHKKQLLYRKLDRLRLIEKHSTDLAVKIHIAHTCIMLYIHIILCEMSTIRFKVDRSTDLQVKIQKFIEHQSPAVLQFVSP